MGASGFGYTLAAALDLERVLAGLERLAAGQLELLPGAAADTQTPESPR